MNFLYLLASELAGAGPVVGDGIFKVRNPEGSYTAIDEIAVFLNNNLVPFTIALCVLGALVAIVLAAAMIKEEDPKKAEDYKKKMVGMAVTILIIIGLVWILGWLITSLESITGAFKEVFSF